MAPMSDKDTIKMHYPSISAVEGMAPQKQWRTQDSKLPSGPFYFCRQCNTSVSKQKIFKHLFLNSVKCLDCQWTSHSCRHYANTFRMIRKGMNDSNCEHTNLRFVGTISDTLTRITAKIIKSSQKSLECHHCSCMDYLKSLTPLADVDPWSPVIKTAMSYKCPCKEAIAPVPTHGSRYLVLRKTVEQCPDCYAPIKTKNLTFNLASWLISYICEECYLPIDFVLQPPGGYDPRLRIQNV